MNPVVGLTTHHSICAIDEKWFLFYHGSTLSKSISHLRCVKATELFYNSDGTIRIIDPYR